mgnify:FL=1
MRLESMPGVVQQESTRVADRLAQTAVAKSNRDTEERTGEGRPDYDETQRRHSCKAADRHHQLDVARTHASSEKEEEKYSAGDASGEGCVSKSVPSADDGVRCNCDEDGRAGEEIRNSALTKIIDRPDASADQGGPEIQQLLRQNFHSGHPLSQQFRFRPGGRSRIV